MRIAVLFSALCHLGFIGCAKSPILNHRMEEPAGQKPQGSANLLEFNSLGLTAEYRWTAGPQSPDESKLELNFQNANQQAVTPTDLLVTLWMPDMGHGSAPTSWISPSTGKIEVNEIYFIMTGGWEVRIKVTAGQQVEEKILKVEL